MYQLQGHQELPPLCANQNVSKASGGFKKKDYLLLLNFFSTTFFPFIQINFLEGKPALIQAHGRMLVLKDLEGLFQAKLFHDSMKKKYNLRFFQLNLSCGIPKQEYLVLVCGFIQ